MNNSFLTPVTLGLFTVLAVASLIGEVILARAKPGPVVDNLNARTRAWWLMCIILLGTLYLGFTATVALFALISFLTLREFITMTPTARGDHRSLFWCFFIILPLQYLLVWRQWYGLFSVLIPVWAFVFISIRNALAGEIQSYLARLAKIHWGLMVCVYFLSHVPMLLTLKSTAPRFNPLALLLFLIIIGQASDVMQYVCGKLWGKRKLAPSLSPSKTWEGLIGGVLAVSLIGAALWQWTPGTPWQAMGFAFMIAVTGFFGGLILSAVKRDHGVKDFGHIIAGHGGMLDRVDSLCFSAPLFFHLVRYCYT
jgi:phosphatidate cytidylyltransferase